MVKAKKEASKMEAYKEASSNAVETMLGSVKSDIEKIDASIAELFTLSLSEAEASFETEISSSNDAIRGPNATISKAIPVLRDTLTQGVANIQSIERWISLNIPIMEDGNNFGVSIQMTINESIKKKRECWTKKLDDIPSYFSSRADAVDKLGLPKVTKSETTTNTKSESTGKRF